MAALVLQESLREDLRLVEQLQPDVLGQFCPFAVDVLQRGVNRKRLAAASQKLGTDEEVVGRIVEALAYLFVESAKAKCTEENIKQVLGDVGIPTENVNVISQSYSSSLERIEVLLSGFELSLPEYAGLRWRLDMEVSSRSLRNAMEPSFVVELSTTTEGRKDSRALQIDIAGMKHLAEELDAALREEQSVHSRRVQRYIR